MKLFRSKIQQHANSTYIFSGSYESVMQNIFVNSKAPFYRLARIIHLGYMEDGPLNKYLTGRFKKLKLDLPANYPENFIRHTKGHPYYTQLAFQQAVLFNTIKGRLPAPDELLNQMLAVEKDYLEKVWEDISNNQEYVHTLRAIAEDSKNIYKRLKSKNINIALATKKLEGVGLLFKDNETDYYIADPLLEHWIIKNL